jgi:pilus assembly protein CpaF
MVASPMQLNSLSYNVVISEKGGAERREIFSISELSIGRVQGNDLLLPKGNVSKQHAKLLFREGKFIVTDLNSTNGTYVNRRRIQQATVVAEGDRIYIGDFVLRIEPNSEDGATWGRTGEQAAISADDSLDISHSVDQVALRQDHLANAATKNSDNLRLEGAVRLGTQPSWSEQSTGKISLNAALAGSGDSNGSLAGRTVRTESPFSASSANVVAGDIDSHGLLGLLVDSVLQAGSDLDFTRIEFAEQRELVERLLDDCLSRLISDGHVPAGAQAERLRLIARNELLDLGPLTRLLEDPSVTEIIVPRYDQVLARKGGVLETADLGFASPHSLEVIIYRLCQHSESPIRADEAQVERRLTGGAYLCAALPPLGADGPSLILRRPRPAATSMQSLVRMGTVSRAIATCFQQSMAARLRVLVVGPRDAEIGIIVGALISAISEGPLLVLEGAEDLGVAAAAVSCVRWSILGCKDAQSILHAAARMATPYVVISLEQSDVTAPTIELFGSGGTGGVIACPGRSIESGLARLTLDVCANRPGLTIDTARRLVAGAFDLVLEVTRYRDGRQRVVRLAQVGRVSNEEIEVDDVFTFVTTSGGDSEVVEGTFKGLGTVPRVIEEMVARGVPFDTNIFGRAPNR